MLDICINICVFSLYRYMSQVKPSTPKTERRGSVKLSAIAEERSIVTTNKETGEMEQSHPEKLSCTGNPNNLELDVRISTGGSAPTESVNAASAPRKAGLRVAMDRVRLKTMLFQDRFSLTNSKWNGSEK